MKVTLLQMDLQWANPAANRETAEAVLLGTSPGSDLYVLPEMWSTGFATQPEGIAESANSESWRWMQSMAARTGAAVAGSIAVQATDGTYRNRFYFVKPDGTTVHYDKHHLFTYGGEHHRYTAGQERVVVEWQGVRFLLQVCYDLRFPIWARNGLMAAGTADYDCILYVASWPTPRVEAWNTLLRARAIENQCYVLGVNRVGTDPTCHYCGGTAFVDPYGTATRCPDGQSAVLTHDLDLAVLQAFRQQFPVLADRD